MKKLLFALIALGTAITVNAAKAIEEGDRFFDGETLYTVHIRHGGILYFTGENTAGYDLELTLEPAKERGCYKMIPSRQAEEPHYNCAWNSMVNFVDCDGIRLFVFINEEMRMAVQTLVLTPDNLQQCLAQQEDALKKPLSFLASHWLMNAAVTPHFNTAELEEQVMRLLSADRSIIEELNLDLMQAERIERMNCSDPESQPGVSDVAARIEQCYKDVNRVYGFEMADIDLDSTYCTRAWNEAYRKVISINDGMEPDDKFFIDDLHWTYAVEIPLEPRYIKVKMISPTQARVRFMLCDEHIEHPMCLEMLKEDGVWKINTWLDANDPYYDLLKEIQEYNLTMEIYQRLIKEMPK